MNERIQQLEKQASDYYWSLDDGVRTADAFTQKFAELIVRECLTQVNASHPLEERSEWSQNSFAEETIKRKIKQHFGVE